MLFQDLSAGWRCTDSEPGKGDALTMSAVGYDTSCWLDVPVPGDVNAALVAAGRMPDPHFGDNARQCYWVTAKEWWYRLELPPAEDKGLACTDLCLDGVDGFADLYLNGERLARMENAFRPYRIDIAGKLKADSPNVLLIRFQSIDEVMGGPREDELGGWKQRRTKMRKPQFNFGWDWSLPLPSIGLAAVPRIERHSGARLVDMSVQTFVSGRLDFKFVVTRAARDAGFSIKLNVIGHGIRLQDEITRPGRVHTYTTLHVPEPKLWWPHGMGEQPLYDYEVLLVVNGEVADRRTGRLGIRETRILEEPFTEGAGPGISFWLEINGQRVFCKGGNWIPLELWPATATDEQYRFYLKKTVEANFNMQRIWGGGIYEREIFYDLCDELGIMVWQDFMFASAGYPLESLRHEIIAEAEYQTKRLRNRPSVVLWCGCNEDVYSWSLPDEKALATADTGIYCDEGASSINRLRDDPQIYSMILRGTVSCLGLGVPYIESSPQSHDDAGNMPESGNCHISAWKYSLFQTANQYDKWRGHFEQVCVFDSEFCIQGPCDVRTLKSFLPEEHHWPPDDMWVYHIQRGHKNLPHYEQTMLIGSATFGEIDSLQKYVKHGQAVHAEMMRAEFESARRDRPNNGGTMMWMFNDCWPTSNWSIIDYYRHPKPSYYAAKRACAPRLPIMFERAGRVEFFFSNDGPDPCEVKLVYGQEGLDGSRLWSRTSNIEVGGCDTRMFFSISKKEIKASPGQYLFISAWVGGHPLPKVTYFPDMWKEIAWPTPNVQIKLADRGATRNGCVTKLRLTADKYARFCHLILPDNAGEHWLDDNFFDLPARSSHEVTIWSAEPVDLANIQIGHWGTEWP